MGANWLDNFLSNKTSVNNPTLETVMAQKHNQADSDKNIFSQAMYGAYHPKSTAKPSTPSKGKGTSKSTSKSTSQSTIKSNENSTEKKVDAAVIGYDKYFPQNLAVNLDINTSNNSLMWICIHSHNIASMSETTRGTTDNIESAGGAEYKLHFLAPNELTENIQHEWSPYEHLGSRLADFDAKMKRWATELPEIKRTLVNLKWKEVDINKTIESIKNGTLMDDATKARLEKALVTMSSNMKVTFNRTDTPLVYKNSNRREFQFTFQLVSGIGDPYIDVVYPVKLLQYLSSPGLGAGEALQNDLSTFTPPNYFTVYSEPDDSFICIPKAALVNIQPTFRGPYIYGYPSSCELQLTFQDLRPLYDDHFYYNKESKITVGRY